MNDIKIINKDKLVKVMALPIRPCENYTYFPELIKSVFGIVYSKRAAGWYTYGSLAYTTETLKKDRRLFVGGFNTLYYKPMIEYYFKNYSTVEYFITEDDMYKKLDEIRKIMGPGIINIGDNV
jgi:hypothetical protein